MVKSLITEIKNMVTRTMYRSISNNLFILPEENTLELGIEKIQYITKYSSSICSDDEEFTFLNRQYKINHNVLTLFNPLIISDSGITMMGHKVVLRTLLDSKGYLTKSGILKFILFPWKRKGKKVSDSYFHLCGIMNLNYFHFLIDSLPRIVDFLKLKKTTPNLKLLINHSTEFTVPYLLACGISRTDIVELNENIIIEQLYISNNKFTQHKIDKFWGIHLYSKKYLSHLAKTLREKTEIITKNKRQRIYISRNDVGNRMVKNEEELMKKLAEYNFQTVHLKNLSVSQQINLFASSEMIVAPHGAGISNIIFSKKAILIELFPINRKKATINHMFQIAQIGSNKHILMKVEDVDEHQNITVNIVKLKLLIDELTT